MSVSTTMSASTNASAYSSGDLRHAVVPVRLEHRDDPLPVITAATGRGEHRRDLGRQMRVVVDEGGTAVDAPDVEPTGDTAEPGECLRDVGRLDADRQGHGCRARGVDHVVHAPQRQLDVDHVTGAPPRCSPGDRSARCRT